MGSMDLPGNKPKPRTATPLVWKVIYITLFTATAYYFHTSTREAAAVRYQLTLSTAPLTRFVADSNPLSPK